jgi:lipopolysaccharide export system protein LptC
VKSAIIFPLILAFILALITFWISVTVEKQGPKIDGSNRHDPDYTMNNFVTSQTDATGKMRYVLAATEMTHYPDDDSTVLQRPRFTLYTADQPYSQIEGLRAYVSSDGEQIELVDNVKVVRQATEFKGEMQLLAERLTILPSQNLVKTNSPVVIKQAPKTVIKSAGGMLFNKNTQTIQLFNRVRAHYERPANKSNKKIKTKPINMKLSNELNPTTTQKLADDNKNSVLIPKYQSPTLPKKSLKLSPHTRSKHE